MDTIERADERGRSLIVLVTVETLVTDYGEKHESKRGRDDRNIEREILESAHRIKLR